MTAVMTRGLGESALRCGHLAVAYDAFNRSQVIYEKFLAEEPNDKSSQNEVMFGHYYLSAYWRIAGNETKAKEECQIAIPAYQAECVCVVDGGTTSCSGH